MRLREVRALKNVLEAAIALVRPMELLVGALEKAEGAGKLPLFAGGKGDVERRRLQSIREHHAGLQQQRRGLGPILTLAHEQAPARHRGERHGALQLGVIAAAGAEIGVGPAMIEHILPIGVRFQVAGHAGGEPPVLILHEEMLGQPAGLASGGAAVLQRPQKGVSDEWVIRAV